MSGNGEDWEEADLNLDDLSVKADTTSQVEEKEPPKSDETQNEGAGRVKLKKPISLSATKAKILAKRVSQEESTSGGSAAKSTTESAPVATSAQDSVSSNEKKTGQSTSGLKLIAPTGGRGSLLERANTATSNNSRSAPGSGSGAGAAGGAGAGAPLIQGGAPMLLQRSTPGGQEEHFIAGKGAAAVKPKILIRTEIESLDSAIASALGSHRNRMQILEIERGLLQFTRNAEMEEKTYTMPSNPYWRMIFYRVADRFRLERSTYEPDIGGTVSATFWRCEETSLPRTLIGDMDLDREWKVYNGDAVQPVKQPTVLMRSQTNNKEISKEEQAPQKMLLMKRGDKGLFGQDKVKDKGSMKKTAEQKERAYALARARIMGDTSDIIHTDINDHSNRRSDDSPPVSPENEQRIKSEESQRGPPAIAHNTNTIITTTDETPGQKNSNKKGKTKGTVFDLGGLGNSVQRALPPSPAPENAEAQTNRANHRRVGGKAVIRDRNDDEQDPDFRRSNFSPNMPNMYGQPYPYYGDVLHGQQPFPLQQQGFYQQDSLGTSASSNTFGPEMSAGGYGGSQGDNMYLFGDNMQMYPNNNYHPTSQFVNHASHVNPAQQQQLQQPQLSRQELRQLQLQEEFPELGS